MLYFPLASAARPVGSLMLHFMSGLAASNAEMPGPAADGVQRIQAVDRAIVLLKAVAASTTPPTVLELARRCGINRATAWRLLRTLEHHGLVDREPLIVLTPEAQPVVVLAEELTPNPKATEWTLRIKQGITFHNGKPLTVDDVIYTFQQILNPKAPASAAAGLASIDAKAMTKLDPYTVRIPCSTPFATLGQALAIPGYSDIIPVGYDVTAPVGTGPFRLKSFSPGTQSVFVRNDNYWQTGLPYLDEIVITDYSDETSQVNALLAGQVDVVNLLSEDVISEVQGESKNVLVSAGGGWNPFTMRVDTGTFADVRIRQAMRLVVDRQQMLDLVFGGFGTLGNDCSGSGPRSTTTACRSGSRTSIRLSRYLKWQFAQDYWFYNFYLPQVSLATLPTASFNETHWDNSRVQLAVQPGHRHRRRLAARRARARDATPRKATCASSAASRRARCSGTGPSCSATTRSGSTCSTR